MAASFSVLPRGTTMLCVAGTESFDTLDGLSALKLDTNDLDLRRQTELIFRTDSYLSPLAQRTAVLLKERVS